jgi:hypothetical protein
LRVLILGALSALSIQYTIPTSQVISGMYMNKPFCPLLRIAEDKENASFMKISTIA